MYGSGRVYKRGGRYWIQFYVAGKKHREPGGATRGEARDLLRARLEQYRDTPGLDRKATLAELLEAYARHVEVGKGRPAAAAKTRARARNIIGHFDDTAALTLVQDPERIERYVAERLTTARPATINRELAALKSALRLAHSRGKIPRVPKIVILPEDNVRQGFVSRAQFDEVRAHLPEWLADAAEFGFLTGWRRAEIFGLTWDRIDTAVDPWLARLATSKSGRPRSVPLVGPLADIIDRQRQRRKGELADGTAYVSATVFHCDGKPIRYIRPAWRKATKAAGVPGLLFHDLRRSAVRNLVAAGVSQEVAMTITGHLTASTFRRYHIVTSVDQEAALRQTFERTEPGPKVSPIRSRKKRR